MGVDVIVVEILTSYLKGSYTSKDMDIISEDKL